MRSKQKRVEVHRADGTSSLLAPTDSFDGESVVPSFTLPVAHIFG